MLVTVTMLCIPKAAVMQALAAVICEPGVNTTEGMLLRDLLQEAAALGRPLFTLFDHPAGRSTMI